METLNLQLPGDLKRSFKAEASQDGKTMTGLIHSWIRSYVRRKEKERAQAIVSPS